MEDPVGVKVEDPWGLADCHGDVRVTESIALEEREHGIGPHGGADAELAGGRDSGGESARDQVGDGGGAGLGDGEARGGS